MTHVVITLVHGTFSPTPAWVQPGSYLRNELTRYLRGNVDFEVFGWSGRNSHAARVRAGEELRRQLRETFARYPRSRHVVVAHSHGGNVARYALRDQALDGRMAGLVCLATPFVLCERRRESGLSGLFLISLGGLPMLVMGIALLAIERAESGSRIEALAAAVVFGLIGLFVLVRLIGFERALLPLGRLVVPIANWNDRHTDRLVKQLSASYLTTPVLCVRASGDEAAWALTRVDASTERPFNAILHIAIAGGGLAVGAGYVGVLAAYAGNWFNAKWLSWAMLGAFGVIGVCTVLMIAFLLFMAAMPTVRVPLLGWEAPFDVWRCRIRVEAVLPGGLVDEMTYDLSPPKARSRWQYRLEHCSVYDDPAVIADVASWIRARAPRS